MLLGDYNPSYRTKSVSGFRSDYGHGSMSGSVSGSGYLSGTRSRSTPVDLYVSVSVSVSRRWSRPESLSWSRTNAGRGLS